jgi:hypothetical protein
LLALAWLAVTRASLADDSDDLVTATATSNEPATATTSDSNYKITK